MVGNPHSCPCFHCCLSGSRASVNQDACRSQGGKISISSSVADSHRNIFQIRFNPSTTLRAEPLNREFIFSHVDEASGNEIKISLARQGMFRLKNGRNEMRKMCCIL